MRDDSGCFTFRARRCGLEAGYLPPLPTKSATDPDSYRTSEQKTRVPPVSMMAIAGFTNTQAPIAPPAAPLDTKQSIRVVGPGLNFHVSAAAAPVVSLGW